LIEAHTVSCMMIIACRYLITKLSLLKNEIKANKKHYFLYFLSILYYKTLMPWLTDAEIFFLFFFLFLATKYKRHMKVYIWTRARVSIYSWDQKDCLSAIVKRAIY